MTFSCFFQNPPCRAHFWRVQVPVYTQTCDLGEVFDFPGVPKSADTGRCQAFQIKEASISEAPPSEACPPYLPASTRGIEMASQILLLSFVFGINFSHHFWHAFFPTFYAFGCPFGSLLAPFGHFVRILASILAPFWLTFASKLHTFF